MNKIVSAILKNMAQAGEQAAVGAVPGGALIDGAVHGFIDHHGDPQTNALDAAEGAIKLVEAMKGADILDEVKFRAGIATVEAGLTLLHQAVKVA